MEFPTEPREDEIVEVEEPSFDPAQKLIRRLTPRMSPELEQDVATMILRDFNDAIQDRREWEARLVQWDDQYYNRTPDKDFPWPGASNYHVPLTMVGVETLKPRLVEAILGSIPPVHIIPTTQASQERQEKVETLLNWQLATQVKLESVVAQSAHLFLLPGLAVAKTYWKVERIRRRMVREFPLSTNLDAILEALFGDKKPRNLVQKGQNAWDGEIPTSPQGGMPLNVHIEIEVLNDGLQVLVDREDVVERPAIDLIEPIDLIMPVKGGHDIDEMPWVQHRQWRNEGWLRERVQLERFYADSVEELLESGTPKGDQPTTDSQGYRQSQDNAEGVEGQGPSNVRKTQWEILEDYRRYDIDGNGIDQEVIFWASKDLPNKILGWDYLENVYGHGRRPIRIGRFMPIPFRAYGLSFPEKVRGVQLEINAVHNQRMDSGTLANLPFFFRRASSTLPPIRQIIRPGEGIDVDNPQQDILIPKFNFNATWGVQEEATLMQYYERLAGIGDLALGRQPNRVGATRTAKGTQTLLAEGGLTGKLALTGFQRFWQGIFSDILALDQEYLPPEVEFRVTGKRPTTIKLKDRSEIRGSFDLRLASSTEIQNREQQRNDSATLLQALMNPAVMQAGIVSKKGIKRAYEDLLKSYGKDPDFYLEPSDMIRSPGEELQRFMHGEYVSPTPGEDYKFHILAHQAALKDPVVRSRRETAQMIQRHLQETYQLQQSMQMAQQLQQQGPGGPGGPPGQGKPPQGEQAPNAQQGAMMGGAPSPMAMMQGGGANAGGNP